MNPADINAWQVILSSLVFPALALVWKAFVWWRDRGDRAKQAGLTREEQRERDMDDRQNVLNRQHSEWFAELRSENTNLRLRATEAEDARRALENRVALERREIERDRNRGWELARVWHGTAHEIHRAFRNLRHEIVNFQQNLTFEYRRTGQEIPQFPVLPDVPPILMGLEEPK